MEMEWTSILPLAFILSSSILLLHLLRNRNNSTTNRLPPGPTGWPLFGNLFSLGSLPHRTLAAMRERHGPVVWLRLGSINTMAILSAEAATDFFKNHDLSFCERTITDLMRVHGFNKNAVSLAPYGSYWRILRKLLTVDIVVNKRLVETTNIRQKCVDDMLTWIEEGAKKCPGSGVHVAQYVFLMTFNLLGNLMLSRDLLDPNSNVTSEFYSSMMGLTEWTGHANIVDLFPWLRWLDPQGLRRKMERDLGKALEIAGTFVRERLEERKSGVGDKERKKDYLDVLVEFQGNGKDEPNKLSEQQLNILILEIFIAGSETTSSTIEWALTELLLNPECLAKAKAELDQVISPPKKVNETDIESGHLPYLQAVVKETLRLHPPIPFLVPRRAMEDTKFKGYHIPKDTQVFVNTWAIGRDPDAWDHPLEFKPERFLGSKLDFKGQNYEFIPFGAGRRMCAGVPLAQRMLHLLLGSLLHEFDWEFDGQIDPKNVDMRDRLGVTMKKYEPLLAVPKKRRL